MEVAAREISPESRIIHSDFIFYYYFLSLKWKVRYGNIKKKLDFDQYISKTNFSSEYLKKRA